jgi:hypothetical protein
MRGIAIGAVCAAIVCAALAPAAASGSEPAFYECVKMKGGKYDAGCAEQGGKGGFAAVEGTGRAAPLKASLTELEAFIPAENAPGELSCKRITFEGALGSPTSMKGVTITGTACKERKREFTCTSEGQRAGTVVTNELGGTLGYVDAAEQRAGIDFTAEGGGAILDYTCSGLHWDATGSWIGEIGPVGQLGREFTMTFQREAEGFQAIKSFEGGLEDVPVWQLDGSGPFDGSLSTTIKYKGPKLLLKG